MEKMKKYCIDLLRTTSIFMVSLSISIFGIVYASTLITSTNQTVSDGDVITSAWYNTINNLLKGPHTNGGICSYNSGKIMCNNTGVGGGGGGGGQEIITGYPNAILCKNTSNTSLNQVFYISGKNTGEVRYSDPYTHNGGGAGSYAMNFNIDGTWGSWFGGAQLNMNDCIGKSLTQLKAMGRTFFYGGSSISGIKRATVLNISGYPEYILCERNNARKYVVELYAEDNDYIWYYAQNTDVGLRINKTTKKGGNLGYCANQQGVHVNDMIQNQTAWY